MVEAFAKLCSQGVKVQLEMWLKRTIFFMYLLTELTCLALMVILHDEHFKAATSILFLDLFRFFLLILSSYKPALAGVAVAAAVSQNSLLRKYILATFPLASQETLRKKKKT